MNRNDTNDVLRAHLRAARDSAAEAQRIARVMARWDAGNADAFDAPAPRVVVVTYEESAS